MYNVHACHVTMVANSNGNFTMKTEHSDARFLHDSWIFCLFLRAPKTTVAINHGRDRSSSGPTNKLDWYSVAGWQPLYTAGPGALYIADGRRSEDRAHPDWSGVESRDSIHGMSDHTSIRQLQSTNKATTSSPIRINTTQRLQTSICVHR